MGKKKFPKVSIVFVNWNGKEDSFNLIESLKKINYPNYDLILVDNGSTDGTPSEFKKKYGKSVTLIENEKNLGLAEGTNLGIREALGRKSDYVLVMNNDMYVDENFLNILVDAMEKHPEVSVSGPKIYYHKPKNKIWCAGCDYSFSGYKPRQQGEIDEKENEEEKYVDGIDCVLMMRADTLKEQGLLDPNLFIIHELTGWCLKTKNLGYKCLYVPRSKVWHKVAASLEGRKKASEILIYYTIRNWIIIVKKNKNFLSFLWSLFLQSTVLAGFRFFKFLKNGQPKLIKTYLVAIWHALINKTPLELYPYKK